MFTVSVMLMMKLWNNLWNILLLKLLTCIAGSGLDKVDCFQFHQVMIQRHRLTVPCAVYSEQ